MSATEEVLEQIPEAVVVDAVEVAVAMRNNPYVIIGVALTFGSLGAFGGYKLSQKRLRVYYEDIANAEIEEAKNYYGHLRKDGVASDPEALLRDLHGDDAVPTEAYEKAVEAHKQYSGIEPSTSKDDVMSAEEVNLHHKHGVDPRPPVEEIVTVERKHTFERSKPVEDDPFDYSQEILLRSGDKPYVLTHDEFYEGEKDYEQTHLTYYQGDDVLVDERDQVIPDEESIVGNDNLTRFGHGSKDENIVFVRNENLEVDFEVTRSFGKYSIEVMGLDDDDDEGSLKHSVHSGGPRRFRQRDE